MSVRIVISGIRGRLGSRIAQWAQSGGSGLDVSLVQGVVREPDGAAADGVPVVDHYRPEPGTVLIETAPPRVALEHGSAAAAAGVPIVLATTGFRPENRSTIDGWSASTAVCVAPNLSLGVNVLLDLVARASAALASYDLEITELHHRRKRDAPSGTAWALARAATEARGQPDLERRAIHARAGEVGARSDEEVGLQVVRGGDIIGEHTVYLIGETERLELTHRAATRDAFAHGALVAAAFVAEQAPGRYGMREVLGLE
jgi:4-hydroxy-tetrahydrodipicolinate reductase